MPAPPPHPEDADPTEVFRAEHSEEPERALESVGSAIDRLGADMARLAHETRRLDRLAALGTVAGLIAHELNNVLTPAVGYGRAALKRPEDRELADKALQRCVESAERATTIVRTVLELASGAVDEPSPVCDVRAVVMGEIGQLDLDDGPAVVVDVPEGLVVAMPAERLARVVQNLVSNARRAVVGAGRGGEVRICAHRCSARNTGAVELVVEDDGPGFPLGSPVFEAFQTGAEKQGGHGLGLTLCRELVRDAGGSIRAERAGSGGARFVVELRGGG